MPQESVSQELFNKALAQLQQRNWDTSISLYKELLDQGLSQAQASVVYHNMSIIAAEKADYLMAYAWSKKALWLDSSNSAARTAFEQFTQLFQPPNIPHQISNFDNFVSVMEKVPLDAWLVTAIVLVLMTVWLFLKDRIQQKKNRLNEIFAPSTNWPLWTSLVFAVIVAAVSFFAFSRSEATFGILISEKARIQTAPGESKPVIFEAPAGLEVEVLKHESGYYQVRSSGAFSGWVESSQVELLSLSFEHKK